MENLLGHLYDYFFKSWYGQELSSFMWGYNPATEAYSNPNLYNLVGLITLVISLIIVVVFYYIINHPRYCKWWSWLLTLGVNSVIALFIGFGITHFHLLNGRIPEDLSLYVNENGTTIYLINYIHCWGFGIANLFVAAVFFIILSFILKWWSSSAKHVPFL